MPDSMNWQCLSFVTPDLIGDYPLAIRNETA